MNKIWLTGMTLVALITGCEDLAKKMPALPPPGGSSAPIINNNPTPITKPSTNPIPQAGSSQPTGSITVRELTKAKELIAKIQTKRPEYPQAIEKDPTGLYSGLLSNGFETKIRISGIPGLPKFYFGKCINLVKGQVDVTKPFYISPDGRCQNSTAVLLTMGSKIPPRGGYYMGIHFLSPTERSIEYEHDGGERAIFKSITDNGAVPIDVYNLDQAVKDLEDVLEHTWSAVQSLDENVKYN